MKIKLTAIALLLAPITVCGASRAPDRETIVCTEGGAENLTVMQPARLLAKKMFQDVGVFIELRDRHQRRLSDAQTHSMILRARGNLSPLRFRTPVRTLGGSFSDPRVSRHLESAHRRCLR